MSDLVPREHIGDAHTPARPHPLAGRLGQVELLAPTEPVVARAWTTLVLRYTAGMYGIDDSGALKLALRFPFDGGALQAEDPGAPNHVRAIASRPGVRIHCTYTRRNPRPWFRALILRVLDDCLRPGDTVELRVGDRSGGSPGLRMQSFCEDHLELQVLVDPIATGHFVPLEERLAVEVVPGAACRWRAITPTRRAPGQRFFLGLKAEDAWGNPTARVPERLWLHPSQPVDGLPSTVNWPAGARALRLDGLRTGAGVLRIELRDAEGRVLAHSTPCVVQEQAIPTWWADLHGQSAETVGVNTARRYFAFGRDLAFLDACSHQGNDFQINARFWRALNELTAELNEAERFLALPGYEWSGNTGVGGDRNVFFREEGRPIRRSSHALLTDRSEADGDCPTAASLFAALAEEDAICYAHVGGRYADLSLAHDGRIERSVEIHSAWGSFEWLLHDAFALGHRVGVVANSDGHKGRPGASYPGAATFGAMGGLTCLTMPRLDRDALFSALRARHHYATTGCRLHLEVEAEVQGLRYAEDPALGPSPCHPVRRARMGDILRTEQSEVLLRVRVDAPTPIERIELRVGPRTVHSATPYPRPTGRPGQPGRLRLQWEGARYRGRSRRADWSGGLQLRGTELLRARKLEDHNPERRLERRGQQLRWQAVTTGNHGGVDLWLSDAGRGRLELQAGPVRQTVDLAELAAEARIEAGGLGRCLRLIRLPERLEACSQQLRHPISLQPTGDSPLWVSVWLEDGHRAWSSPIYLIRDPG